MMKILLLTPMPPDRTAPGAIPAVLHAQLLGLRDRHDVTVVTIAGPDPRELAATERLVADGVEVHAARRRALPRPEQRACSRRRVASWLRTDWPWRTVSFWAPGLEPLIARLAAQRRFDVIAVEDVAMAVYGLPPDVPRVLTEHEVRDAHPPIGAPARPRQLPVWLATRLNWRRWASHQPRLWRSFDVVQAFTDRDAETIRRRAGGSTAVRVTPFGIALPERPPLPEEPDQLVFVGNFAHAPNVDAALWLGRDILPRVRARRPAATLAIAGMFPPPELRALEGNGVRVLGGVGDVDALVQRAAVVCAPVRTGGGMRMKVLQAMACGKAVVTTPLGVEGLTTDGRVAPLAVGVDADALAARAAELLADADSRRSLGDAARAFTERHHSPGAYAGRLTESYELAIELRSDARARRSRPTTPELTSST
jgi:glycosyltransferase involved in cell wall biosynthesis